MATTDEIHSRHMADDCADVPDSVRREVSGYLDTLATHVSRDEFAAAIESLYAAHGVWEEFLSDEARRSDG